MDPRIGCRASGLGTGILLEGGIPMAETMQTLLQSIDEQLGDTNRQIESCVKSILEMSNNVVGSEYQKFYHPGEALSMMAEQHILEKSSCIDPHTADITHMLKHTLEMLDTHPGCEESALQCVFQLSSLEGVCLPEKSGDSVTQSLVSINAVEDDTENRNEALWNEICNRLRKFYVGKLGDLPVSPLPVEIDLYTTKRLQYVQSLCSLHTPKDIWAKYRNLRSQQYTSQLLSYSQRGSSRDTVSFSKAVQHFERLVLFSQVMMQEDFRLFNSGVFGGVIGTLDAINEIYLDKLQDDIAAVTDALQSELSTISVKNLSKGSSKDDSKVLPKSSSDTGSLGRYRGSLRKQHSKSLDSLLSQEDNFTDLQNLPTNSLGQIVRFVNCVLHMDEFVRHLRSLLTWEINTLSSRGQQPKRLKSALKSRRDSDLKLNSMRQTLMSESGLLDSGTFTNNFGSLGTQAMTATLTSSLKVVERKAEEKDSWNWRCPFLKVSVDLAKCLEIYIGEVSDKVLEGDAKYFEKHREFEMVSVSDSLTGGRLDYPKQVSQGVYELFLELDSLLPLAKAFSQSPLDVIKAAFVDCTTKTVKTIYTKTNKTLEEVTEQCKVSVMFQLLANSSFIRNHLLYFDSILTAEDNGKKSFNLLYKQWCEVTEHVSCLLTDYQHLVLTTAITQDAESHYWDDTKDFYEDERCSFSVQQWALHMKALCSDLWVTCSPRSAQHIYMSTLSRALSLFEQRYSRVTPSYKRTKQVRYDITAILLCVQELLFSGCVNMGMYLEPSTNQSHAYSVHTSCLSLLSILAVVTSPLDVLYKVFKKGSHHKRKHGRVGDPPHRLYLSQWLSWICPHIFLPGKESLDEFQTTTALYLQLKLTFSQPDRNWTLFLQSLVMKEYTLPILLLTQVSKHYRPSSADNRQYDEPADNPAPLSSLSGSRADKIDRKGEEERGAEMDRQVEKVFSDMVEVLILLEGFPAALAKVLLPVFERTDTWYLLDNTTTLGETHPIPPWIQAVLNCLQTFVKRLVEPGVKVFLEKQGKSASGELVNREQFEPFSSVMPDLPCGCPFSHTATDSARKPSPSDEENAYVMEDDPKGHKELVAEAVYSVITQMNDDIYMLPTPLIMFCKAAQQQLSGKGLHASHNCLAIKLLATCVRAVFEDTEQIEGMLGVSLDLEVKDNLQMLGECTYYVLTAESHGKSSGIPKMASMFMKANRNWLSEQVELLSDHFSNDIFELPDPRNSLQGMPEDYIEQLMTSVISHLHNSPYGLHPLKSAYHLVHQNLEWIIEQLDIPPVLGNPVNARTHHFQLTTSARPAQTFNPLKEANLIGSAKFDQEAIMAFDYEWQTLLHSDLGLSEVGFKELLFHRHEMQEGAYLEEEEKKPVQVLCKKYHVEGAELV